MVNVTTSDLSKTLKTPQRKSADPYVDVLLKNNWKQWIKINESTQLCTFIWAMTASDTFMTMADV